PTGVFVQARLGSTRLAGKILLELRDGCLIQHVMRATRGIGAAVHAVLTDASSADVLRPLVRQEGFELFVGPEEDVLARYCQAARAWGVDEIIRVTGDNPLTSTSLAVRIQREHRLQKMDLSHYLGIPWGTGVEVVQAAALFQAEREARAADEREHITTWLYRHADRFRILEAPAPAGADLPQGRATVDTAEDLARLRRLFDDLYDGSPIEIHRVIPWLQAHPHEGPAHG
ncbi:MAG TPA: acylneuraminate cytidylyltransferase, partial [bacterium]|nr:acylneuraminate cytidylyltransferase [bacterium]